MVKVYDKIQIIHGYEAELKNINQKIKKLNFEIDSLKMIKKDDED
jgi:hypothetical protein